MNLAQLSMLGMRMNPRGRMFGGGGGMREQAFTRPMQQGYPTDDVAPPELPPRQYPGPGTMDPTKGMTTNPMMGGGMPAPMGGMLEGMGQAGQPSLRQPGMDADVKPMGQPTGGLEQLLQAVLGGRGEMIARKPSPFAMPRFQTPGIRPDADV